jgi:sodium transport system ATP-binding protein
MNEFRDIPGARLSTGMKQKVSIARALVHDPPVLIFDEPTLGLDVLVTRSLHNIILELRDQGKCILFSTHIMREVERLCDRVAIMHRGKVLDAGSLSELSDRHGTSDFEELFYQLIVESERTHQVPSQAQILESVACIEEPFPYPIVRDSAGNDG